MALSSCGLLTDERERELTQHGTQEFPFSCYHDDLRADPVPWHWHDELEVCVVERGVCRFSTGAEEAAAGEGQAVFFNSGVLHTCVPDAEEGECVLRSVVFSPVLVGGAQDSVFWEKYVTPLCRNSGVRLLHLGNGTNCLENGAEAPGDSAAPSETGAAWQHRAISHVLRAWEAGEAEPPAYEITVRNELSLFVALLAENGPRPRGGIPAADVRNESRMKQMLRFIRGHYAEDIDTADIAASASISASETLRCFRRMLGTTPIRYLAAYRLEKAELMLATTDLRVSEIGERCGFREMSYFTKAFHKKTGRTPKEYRAQFL